MKKIQKSKKHQGFIGIIIAIIAALIIAGGAGYLYIQHQKNKVATNSQIDFGTNNPDDITYSNTGTTTVANTQNLSTTVQSTTTVQVTINTTLSDTAITAAINSRTPSGNFKNSITHIYRGDFNNDGYEDAVVTGDACAASCGSWIDFVINQKNGTGKLLTVTLPGDFQLVGAGQTNITNIAINTGGTISVSASNFCGGLDQYNTCSSYLSPQTKNFKLQGNALDEVNTSGWQTYNFEATGKIFYYPVDWNVQEVKDTAGAVDPTLYLVGAVFSPNAKGTYTSNDSIMIDGPRISVCSDVPDAVRCVGGGKDGDLLYTRSHNSNILSVFDQMLDKDGYR